MAYRQLPLLTAPPPQCTMRRPMSEAIARLHQVEARPGVVTATLSMGFPFADIRDAGASILVTTDADQDQADQCADAAPRTRPHREDFCRLYHSRIEVCRIAVEKSNRLISKSRRCGFGNPIPVLQKAPAPFAAWSAALFRFPLPSSTLQ